MNNNAEKSEERLSRYNTRRSSIGEDHKPYENMLLKELPGVKRSNAPMHAVLESALEDNSYDGMHEAQKVRDHALIHYLASLANSNNNEDIFDFDFVESLIENGADINSTDRSGQTIFHEVARSWNLDVAMFLLEHGADVNQQDKFGRSPLHVAAAVDYSDMVRFLIKNGADINITTYGEQQMPIHYAAKNDACRSLKMLLGYEANIDSRDSKNRTPLQVAAEMNRAKSAKLLVQHGAPAGVHDNMGNSALSLLIEKLPDVAIEALDQFHSVSTINRKEFFFLNYLEGNRLQDRKSPAYTALEIAVQAQEFDIILHPVMKRLIDVKWQKFGRQGAIISLCLNLLYAILWTILAVTSPNEGDELYLPWSRNVWRLIISVIVCLMTVDEIRKQVTGTIKTRNRQKKWISWRASELEDDLSFCHPRWPQEEMYLKSEIKAIRNTPLISTGDSWVYFDWFSLILILGTIASHVVFFNINNDISQVVHARIITVLLLVLWLRIMQYARPFEGAGPFVAIFGHIFNDIINWGILTLLVTIPYACAFWITFGDNSSKPVQSYSELSPLLYQLFSMIVVNDHDFDQLQEADATMARILCGSYIAIMAIINLNILIALLSDTFTRVYGNAIANAVMQRAKTILFLEKSLTSKRKREYKDFIKNYGSPETVELQRDISGNADRDEQKAADTLKESVQEIHNLIHERFGKQYGEGKKSDLDHIREKLENIQQGSIRHKCGCKGIKRKIDIIQEVLIRVSNSLKVDISGLDNKPHSSSDDDTLVPQFEGKVPSSEQTRPKNSNYEDYSQISLLSVREHSPNQQLWSMKKSAFNEGYRFEDDEPATSMRRSSAQPLVKARRGSDRNRGSYDLNQANSDEEFDKEAQLDPSLVSYRQPRDEKVTKSSREERRKFRADDYQKRLRRESESSTPERRREPMWSRAEVSRAKVSPRAEILRTESMPARTSEYDSPRRSWESRYARAGLKRNSPDSLRRQMEETGPGRQTEFRPRTRRSPERRSKSHGRRNSYEIKRYPTKQRQPEQYKARKSSEKYYEGRSRETQRNSRSEADSEVSESDVSQKESYEDNPNVPYSDNDVIRKRARLYRERRYLENWDNRSVKSVAF